MVADELDKHLPDSMKKEIADMKIDFYTINASQIAEEIGLSGRINMIIQAAFFKLSNVLPVEDAVRYLKDSIYETYGKKGEKIVQMNNLAVDRGMEALVKIDVPESWSKIKVERTIDESRPEFVREIADVANAQEGYSLPVSKFVDRMSGEIPSGTAAYEKRGIALRVPDWKIDNCIQCNQCAYVCPHAVIRPFLLTEEEKAKAPRI